MDWFDLIKNYNIVLASKSPRRQKLLRALGVDFSVQTQEVDEVYDPSLIEVEITDYLACLKAKEFTNLGPKDILITSDTIVWINGRALGKPKDLIEAREMLELLSNERHSVFTSIALTTRKNQVVQGAETAVEFAELSPSVLDWYLANYEVLDKAGAYGVQTGIGLTHVTTITGSYYNVMGLPTHLLPGLFEQVLAD